MGEHLEWLQAKPCTHADPGVEQRETWPQEEQENSPSRLSVGMEKLAIQSLQAPVPWSLGHPSPEEFQPG